MNECLKPLAFAVMVIAVTPSYAAATFNNTNVPAPAAPAKNLFDTSDTIDSTTTVSVEPTGLAAPINAAVLQGTVQKRLNVAQQKAMADLIKRAAANSGTSPGTRDLLMLLADGVELPLSAEAAAQTFTLGITRSALAVAVHGVLTSDELVPYLGKPFTDCNATGQVPQAVYETLSKTKLLTNLAWPKTERAPVDAACKDFMALIDAVIEGGAAFGSLSVETRDAVAGLGALALEVADCASDDRLKNSAYGALGSEPTMPTHPRPASTSEFTLRHIREFGQQAAVFVRDSTDPVCQEKALRLKQVVDSAISPLLNAKNGPQLSGFVKLSEAVTYLTALSPGLSDSALGKLPEVLEIVRTIRTDGKLNRQATETIIELLDWGYGKAKTELAVRKTCGGNRDSSCAIPEEVDLIITSILAALPSSIVDRGSSVALDGPGLLRLSIARYAAEQRKGPHLRATIGMDLAGIVDFAAGPSAVSSPILAEELGVGWYPIEFGPLLTGPHLIASGVLYQISGSAAVKDRIFVGVGWSANIYRAIDVSLTSGVLTRLSTTQPDYDWMTTVGLQVPVFDYLDGLQGSDQ